MTTKELLEVKEKMLSFLQEVPLSIKTVPDVVQFAESIKLVNTLLIGAMMQQHTTDSLDIADKKKADKQGILLRDIMDKVQAYIEGIT